MQGERQEWGTGLVSRLNDYAVPHNGKAVLQIAGSLVPFVVTWALMYQSLEYSYWLTLVLAVPAAGFLLRIFLLQHDLGHGSLLRSKRANDWLGCAFSVLTVIPYHHWRRVHADHHSHSGDLDRRGPGCVMILTVGEYLERSRWRRLLYRLRSHPLVVLVLGGPYLFLLIHRYPYEAPPFWRKERRGVHLTNLALLILGGAGSFVLGLGPFLKVHLPILCLYSSAAVWLFVVQHCFEDTYWEPSPRWDFFESALMGSSYYELPRLLRWFTLNAGFHHVHHLHPKVPNYHLARCHDEIEELHRAPSLSLRASLRSPRFVLWDEERKRLVGFRDLSPRDRVGPGASDDRREVA